MKIEDLLGLGRGVSSGRILRWFCEESLSKDDRVYLQQMLGMSYIKAVVTQPRTVTKFIKASYTAKQLHDECLVCIEALGL